MKERENSGAMPPELKKEIDGIFTKGLFDFKEVFNKKKKDIFPIFFHFNITVTD